MTTAVVVALLTTPALAQSGAPGTIPPSPSTEPAAQPDTVLAVGTGSDVNADRAWVTSTALIQPAGSWTFHNRELMVFGVTYGVTERIQVSANVFPAGSKLIMGWLTVKAKVLQAGRFHLAVHGLGFNANAEHFAGMAGVAGTVCIDSTCASNVTAHAGRGYGPPSDTDGPFVLSSLSLTVRLNPWMKFVGEFDHYYKENTNGAMAAWYGIRFSNHKVGLELGLIKPMGDDADDGSPVGYPWISITFRPGR